MAEKAKQLIDWMPTANLLQQFHPGNPRDHGRAEIEQRAINMLWYGWLEIGISLNSTNNKLVSGHGTVKSADYLRVQSAQWFDTQLDQWQKRNKVWTKTSAADKAELEKARFRFSPQYWELCPVKIVDLTEPYHDALMANLNLSKRESPEVPDRLAKLIATMDYDNIKDAGISDDRKADLLQKYKLTMSDRAADVAKNTVVAGLKPDKVVSDVDDDDEVEYAGDEEYEGDDGEDDLGSGDYAIAPPPLVQEKVALNITLEWMKRKKWSSLKLEQGHSKDTECFLKEHAAFKKD
jgi:hypothetical protein